MTVYKAQIAFDVDTALPRDRMVITPHFFGSDAQGLANALDTNLKGITEVGATHHYKISIYDAEKAPPSYPLAVKENTGTPFASGYPRELALCLSYYSTYNRKRTRGRLYLPNFLFPGGASTRPTAGQITKALAFHMVFVTGLPASHNWVVYSPTDKKSMGVTDCWVDDEWDIMRSRGTRSTSRQAATVP